ncbi:MAG TPA: hypothetical protein VN042_00575 [Asticcacaulis sp.]|nr:hypothetical protein [Asticcacaulis sp.]
MPMRILPERKRSPHVQIQFITWVIASIVVIAIAADPEHRLAFVLINLFARLSGLILA